MIERRPDDGMIEIGDIEDEPTPTPEPPPRVVIEYRDRGIPWMLVPPLLVLFGVIIGVFAYQFRNRLNDSQPSGFAVKTLIAEPVTDFPTAPLSNVPLPADPATPESITASNPPVLENPPAPVSVPVAGQMIVEAPRPTVSDPATGEPAAPPVQEPVREVAPAGFDPKAFERSDAPIVAEPATAPVDPSLAPVAQAEPPPSAATTIELPIKPELVDPDLLPPDPRAARVDRQRRSDDARRQLEQERFRFHTELSLIYKKLGRRSVPLIQQVCKAYDREIPLAAREEAQKMLGRNGLFAGADPRSRINLLRRLGFPETAILGDLFDIESRHESSAARNAASREAMYLRSVSILLNNPPGRPGGTARAISANSGNSRQRAAAPDAPGLVAPASNP